MGMEIQLLVFHRLPYFAAREYHPPYFWPKYSATSLISSSLSA